MWTLANQWTFWVFVCPSVEWDYCEEYRKQHGFQTSSITWCLINANTHTVFWTCTIHPQHSPVISTVISNWLFIKLVSSYTSIRHVWECLSSPSFPKQMQHFTSLPATYKIQFCYILTNNTCYYLSFYCSYAGGCDVIFHHGFDLHDPSD